MFNAYDIQFPQLTTIPADDGFEMPAQILKPKNFQSGQKYPVIIYVYGGASAPQVVNAFQWDTLWYQLLLEAGYVVVKVDNRSATGISKTLENSIVKRVGEGETRDLVSAAALAEEAVVGRSRSLGSLGLEQWRVDDVESHDAFAGIQSRHLRRTGRRLALLTIRSGPRVRCGRRRRIRKDTKPRH
jgi:hypothetical protein